MSNTREENAAELADSERAHERLRDERNAFIGSLGLTYRARFVPASEAEQDPKDKHARMHWRVSFTNGVKTRLETDYSEGLGCVARRVKLPSRKLGYTTLHDADIERTIVERGKVPFAGSVSGAVREVPAPDILDVLHCIVLDSEAIEYATFEEWAASIGFDTDSREAEKIYNQCREHGLRLRQMIGDTNLSKLRELFQDY